jgi:NAD-dependent SIR2 family protein deacetylase
VQEDPVYGKLLRRPEDMFSMDYFREKPEVFYSFAHQARARAKLRCAAHSERD